MKMWQTIPVIPYEEDDEPLHEGDGSVCSDPTCPCHEGDGDGDGVPAESEQSEERHLVGVGGA